MRTPPRPTPAWPSPRCCTASAAQHSSGAERPDDGNLSRRERQGFHSSRYVEIFRSFFQQTRRAVERRDGSFRLLAGDDPPPFVEERRQGGSNFVSDETDYTIPRHGEARRLPHVE